MKKIIAAIAMTLAAATAVFAETNKYGYGMMIQAPARINQNEFHMFKVEDTIEASKSLSHATYYKAMCIANDIKEGNAGIIGVDGITWTVVNIDGTLYQIIKK